MCNLGRLLCHLGVVPTKLQLCFACLGQDHCSSQQKQCQLTSRYVSAAVIYAPPLPISTYFSNQVVAASISLFWRASWASVATAGSHEGSRHSASAAGRSWRHWKTASALLTRGSGLGGWHCCFSIIEVGESEENQLCLFELNGSIELSTASWNRCWSNNSSPLECEVHQPLGTYPCHETH